MSVSDICAFFDSQIIQTTFVIRQSHGSRYEFQLEIQMYKDSHYSVESVWTLRVFGDLIRIYNVFISYIKAY